MSGWNRPQALQAATSIVALVLGATTASAATKTSNPYQQVIPKTFEYNTTGTIQTKAAPHSITGPNQLSFNGVNNAVYATGSNQTIQLGQFTVNPATTASGDPATTTYHDTPFLLQVRAPAYDKSSKIPVLSSLLPSYTKQFHLKTETLNSLLIKGHLDGTVNGTGTSSVTATIDSTRLGGVNAPKGYAINYTFPVRYADLKLPTSWTMNTTGNALASTTTASTALASTGTTASAAMAASTSAAAQILATPAAETLTADPLASPTPTPEPATILIFAAGAAGLAWSRRRQAK